MTSLSDTPRQGQVWRHKHRDIKVKVNLVWGDALQVLNEAETHLRWLTIKGFLRDYELDV